MFDIIRDRIWGEEPQDAESQHGGLASVIEAAVQYGPYGLAIWDQHFNLITANGQYADLHKIPSTLLSPGSNLRAIMHNLKGRGVLTQETDPDVLMEIIQTTIAETGHLTSYIRLSDDTLLEIAVERMSNGNCAAFLRNATRDKLVAKTARATAEKTEAYADAIAKFPLGEKNKRQKNITSDINQITQTVATLMEIDWCVVWTRSKILNEAAAASAYQSATGLHVNIENMVLPDLAGYLVILETSQVIAIDDLDKHAFGKEQGNRAPLDEYAYASLDAPFRQNGQIMGVLSCLDTKRARNWTATDKMFAMSAASHIGNLISTSDQGDLWDLPTGEVYAGRQAAE